MYLTYLLQFLSDNLSGDKQSRLPDQYRFVRDALEMQCACASLPRLEDGALSL